jgi:hypothetical protein
VPRKSERASWAREARRDGRNKHLIVPDDVDFVITNYVQRMEVWRTLGASAGHEATASARTAQQYAAAVLVPIYGKAVQRPGTVGFEPDGFMLRAGSFRFFAMDDVASVVINGWLPEQHGRPIEITATCADATVARTFEAGTLFALELRLAIKRGVEERLHIGLGSSFVPAALPGGSTDNRQLGCILVSVQFA